MAATETVVVDASALLPLILPDVPGRKRFAVDLVTDAEAGRIRLLVPQVCHTSHCSTHETTQCSQCTGAQLT